MTLNLQIPEVADLRPKITVFGVGGAGCNAVNNMIEKNLDGVDFIVAIQMLRHCNYQKHQLEYSWVKKLLRVSALVRNQQ